MIEARPSLQAFPESNGAPQIVTPREGETWVSKDTRDNGLTVRIEEVANGYVTYKRFNRRAVRIENFVKLYRPREA